jgi:hypothetical protein
MRKEGNAWATTIQSKVLIQSIGLQSGLSNPKEQSTLA